jgi:hypothetical protein
LESALDRFCEVADDRRFGIEGVHVIGDGGRCAERRWIADIRRDVFSVSKTVTSLAVGMLAHDGLLTLDDPVLLHLPELADTAAPGSEAMTVGHLLSMTISCCHACSGRSASEIRSGCAVLWASRSVRSDCTCEPQRSPGSRSCSCGKVSTTAGASYRPSTSRA